MPHISTLVHTAAVYWCRQREQKKFSTTASSAAFLRPCGLAESGGLRLVCTRDPGVAARYRGTARLSWCFPPYARGGVGVCAPRGHQEGQHHVRV